MLQSEIKNQLLLKNNHRYQLCLLAAVTALQNNDWCYWVGYTYLPKGTAKALYIMPGS